MFAKSYGAVTFGVNERIIDVDVSYGFPAFDIVGLLDTAVKESRERVRTATKYNGPLVKTTFSNFKSVKRCQLLTQRSIHCRPRSECGIPAPREAGWCCILRRTG